MDEVSWAVRELHLARLPTIPVASRWTKPGPCIDWLSVGTQSHGLLPELFDKAFKSFPIPVHAPVVDDNIDPAIQQELTWHAIAGKRVHKSRAFLASKAHMIKSAILASVL